MSMSSSPALSRPRPRRMLAAVTAFIVAVTASVFGAALPASAAGTASISGTVTASDGGAPLEGISVSWLRFNESGVIIGSGSGSSTAADGTFTVGSLEAGEYTLDFFDPGGTYLSVYLGSTNNPNLSQRVVLADAENATGADIALVEPGSVSGTVTDSNTGVPVEGVDVYAQLEFDGSIAQRTATTDATGEYVITGMPIGATWVVFFDATDDGYILEYFDSVRSQSSATPVAVTAGDLTPNIDATLDQGATITGSVARASNPSSPVEGVQVEVFDDFGNYFDATTLVDGSYELLGIPAGEYRLRAFGIDDLLGRWWNGADSYDSADIITLTSGQTLTGIDLLLEEAGTISGVVTGPLGEPLESVDVNAYPDNDTDSLYAVTDENGAYVLTGVGTTDYELYFRPSELLNIRPQYWPGSDLESGATPVPGAAGAAVNDIDIQLPAGAIIRGTVWDDATDDVLEGIDVMVESESMDVRRFATTDFDGDWVINGLPSADDYYVFFADYSDTYVSEWYDGESSRETADELTLQVGSTLGDIDATLVRAATVTGMVVDELGEGIPDVEVWFAPGGSFGDAMRTATTASDGVYELVGLAPGSYRVLTGGVFNDPQQYRTEWYESVYDPQVSDTVELNPGQQLVDFDFELAANDDPEPPAAVVLDILDEGSAYPTLDFTLPESADGFAFGLYSSINFGTNGGGFLGSFFDPLEWSLNDDWQGFDGHGRVMVQAFNGDGFGPAVRELVTVGDGPGIESTPEPRLVAADGASVTVSWSIDEVGDGVDYWAWDVFTVDEPGEPYLQTGYEEADDPFSETQAISGLEPETDYEIFVMGFDDESGDTTFWGRGVFTTTDGPEVLGLTQTPTPTVTGGPRLGGTLEATAGTWAPAPVALDYQWLRNGAVIPGAESTVYEPTIADLGAELSVRVTGSKTGYLTVSRTSAATSPVVDLGAASSDRLSGADRYATAVDISQSAYGPGVPVVYLATGTGFADALSAASAAASLGGPLLVTLPTSVPTVIRTELVRLDPQRVVIVGGTGVVSSSVASTVAALLPDADIERHFGPDRYATSRDIAIKAFTPGETPVAFIATGRNFPDALAASAAAGAQGAPVILVDGESSSLPTAARNLLRTLEVERVVIAGGTAVVSNGIRNALRTELGASNVTRLSGGDRYLTAVAINDGSFTSANRAYFATGLDFPDALAGAALAGAQGAPLYTVPGTCVPSEVLDSMARLGVSEFVMLGGTSVLSNRVASLRTC